jgi:hypothetical protein
MSSNDATLPAPTETNDVEIPDAPATTQSDAPIAPIGSTNGEDTPIADAPPSASDDATNDATNDATPTAAAPEAEPAQEEPLGRRAQTLSVFFPKALEKCLSMISYSKLAECFPTLAGARPEVLTRIHASMVENMRGKTTVRCTYTFSSMPSISIAFPKFPISLGSPGGLQKLLVPTVLLNQKQSDAERRAIQQPPHNS